MSEESASPQSRLSLAVLLCAIAVLWMATRHYFGVVQDARFYTLEVLRDLDPARFADDLYFKFGSQGSFSLFSRIYLPFVSHLGVGLAGMIFTIAGQLCWIFGLVCLTRSWVEKRYLSLSLATVIVMPNAYAFFGYGEDFATPRLFSEALVMLALSLLKSRAVWAWPLLGLSAALHPLMALPGLAVAFVYFALSRPILWVAVPVGATLAWTLAIAGVAPFADLRNTIDPAWFSIIQLRAAQCLLTTWSRESYFQIVSVFAWVGFAWWATAGRERRFLAALLVVSASSLIFALLGGDIARNVFVVELQPWRSLWLLQLVSRIFTPVVLGLLLARISLVAGRKTDHLALTGILTMGLILASAATTLTRVPYAAVFAGNSILLVIPALAIIFVQLVAVREKQRWIRLTTALAAVALIPLAAMAWDQRTPWTRFVESPAPPPQELTAMIPSSATVYWEGGPEMLWLKLKRSNYFTCEHGTGVVFHRETAIAYKERLDSFWPLRLSDLSSKDDCRNHDSTQKTNRTRRGLEALCKKEAGLDYLVLMSPIPGARSRTWKSPAQSQDLHLVDGKVTGHVTDRFYIHACREFR